MHKTVINRLEINSPFRGLHLFTEVVRKDFRWFLPHLAQLTFLWTKINFKKIIPPSSSNNIFFLAKYVPRQYIPFFWLAFESFCFLISFPSSVRSFFWIFFFSFDNFKLFACECLILDNSSRTSVINFVKLVSSAKQL